MTRTYEAASDEMFSLVKQAWDAGTIAIVGYIPTLYWPGITESATTDGDKFSARITRATVKDIQSTLCTNVGSNNQRRFTNYGFLQIQVKCPKSVAQAYVLGGRLAKLLQASLRKHDASGEVWFTNVRFHELPVKDLFYRFDVIADYQYDDIS